MAEGVDAGALGRCEMLLKDELRKRKDIVQALEDLEVFRQVDNRLPKMLQERAMLQKDITDLVRFFRKILHNYA